MLSVILVNWNGWGDTLACVQSLLGSGVLELRIIVVDNMSSDNSMEAFQAWAERRLEVFDRKKSIDRLASSGSRCARRVTFAGYCENESTFAPASVAGDQLDTNAVVYFVSSGRNGGFGFGCNVGMRLADVLGTDAYWLLNNDCLVPAHTPQRVSAAISADPDKIYGTIVRYYAEPHAVQSYGGSYFSARTGKTTNLTSRPTDRSLDVIYGASFILARKLREAVGDFDEAIFMYYEEVDYCIRAANAGFSFDVIHTDVYHRHGASQGGESVFAWRHVLLNKWYVLHKNYGWGFWVITYLFTLILRCVTPFGPSNARLGARQALQGLIFKGRK